MSKRSEVEWEQWEFPLEGAFQAHVLKRLKPHSVHIAVVKVTKANINGVSDILLCVDGRYVAIELKVGSNSPTFHQKEFLKSVAVAGGVCGVAWNWKEVKDIIKRAGYDMDVSRADKGGVDGETKVAK